MIAHYDITLKGCDDATTVTLSLNDDQASAVALIASATVAASEFDCQPVMTITRHTGATP